jgi:hypothetical protein
MDLKNRVLMLLHGKNEYTHDDEEHLTLKAHIKFTTGKDIRGHKDEGVTQC